MRAQRAAMLNPQGTAKLKIASDDVRTKSVITAEHVTKRFGERTIIKDFSLRIQRGDRIGLGCPHDHQHARENNRQAQQAASKSRGKGHGRISGQRSYAHSR